MYNSQMGGEPISVNGKLQTPAGSIQDALGGTALLETPTVNTVLGGTASIGTTPTPSSLPHLAAPCLSQLPSVGSAFLPILSARAC